MFLGTATAQTENTSSNPISNLILPSSQNLTVNKSSEHRFTKFFWQFIGFFLYLFWPPYDSDIYNTSLTPNSNMDLSSVQPLENNKSSNLSLINSLRQFIASENLCASNGYECEHCCAPRNKGVLIHFHFQLSDIMVLACSKLE